MSTSLKLNMRPFKRYDYKLLKVFFTLTHKSLVLVQNLIRIKLDVVLFESFGSGIMNWILLSLLILSINPVLQVCLTVIVSSFFRLMYTKLRGPAHMSRHSFSFLIIFFSVGSTQGFTFVIHYLAICEPDI